MKYTFPSISIQQMIIFVTVVDEKGFVNASRSLSMTQSAVSKAIAKLEQELGLKLFNRSTRYLEITEAGSLLYEDWKIHLSALQHGYEQALAVQKNSSDFLRIGLMNTANPEKYFSGFITEFTKANPDIKFEAESEYMTILERELEKGSFDIIFVPDFARFYMEKRALKWKYFALDTAKLIMSDHHSLAKKKSVSTKDLLDLKFVTVSTFTGDTEYYQDLCQRFAPYEKKPEVAHIYKSAYDIRYLFRPDEAVLFVDSYFDYPDDAQDFVILPVKDQKNGLICVWKEENKKESLLRFLEALPNI